MGHNLLPTLPRTRKWTDVVEMVAAGAGVQAIAQATMEAARAGLEHAADDPALVHSFWLLTQITQAARHGDFASRLRHAGLDVPDSPTLFDIVGAFSDAVDHHISRTGGRSDLGEMAEMSAASTLAARVGQEARGLFGRTPDDVQQALRQFSTPARFGNLATDFFSRLTYRYLSYYLSRELSMHVGAGRRFANIDEHAGFKEALDEHCCQSALIARDFARGWYSKAGYEGGITPRKAKGFLHVAVRKIRDELSRRAGPHGEDE